MWALRVCNIAQFDKFLAAGYSKYSLVQGGKTILQQVLKVYLHLPSSWAGRAVYHLPVRDRFVRLIAKLLKFLSHREVFLNKREF